MVRIGATCFAVFDECELLLSGIRGGKFAPLMWCLPNQRFSHCSAWVKLSGVVKKIAYKLQSPK